MERSCKNCQQRRVGCHANCERYKADCAQDAKRRAYEKQFAYLDSMPQTATALKKTLAPRRRLSQNRAQLTYYNSAWLSCRKRLPPNGPRGGRVGGLYRGYFKVHSPPRKEKK